MCVTQCCCSSFVRFVHYYHHQFCISEWWFALSLLFEVSGILLAVPVLHLRVNACVSVCGLIRVSMHMCWCVIFHEKKNETSLCHIILYNTNMRNILCILSILSYSWTHMFHWEFYNAITSYPVIWRLSPLSLVLFSSSYHPFQTFHSPIPFIYVIKHTALNRKCFSFWFNHLNSHQSVIMVMLHWGCSPSLLPTLYNCQYQLFRIF